MKKRSPRPAPNEATKEATPSGVSTAHVDALLSKLRSGATLHDDDSELLANIVESWAYISERAQRFDLSMADLRRILGVLNIKKPGGGHWGGGDAGGGTAAGGSGNSGPLPGLPGGPSVAGTDAASTGDSPAAAEPSDPVAAPVIEPTADSEAEEASPRRDEHGRRGGADFDTLPVIHHTHCELSAGCRCPACLCGKLYHFFPRTFVTIAGQAPFVGHRHKIDRLQCNRCGEIFEAPLPQGLQDDGVGNGRLYTHSATTLVVMLKYLGVMPWHRQETLQGAIGVSVPDSSMSDMCENMANTARPVIRKLQSLAAQAPLFYGDDTSATILGLEAEIRIQRKTGKETQRTGCHTTCVIARTATGQHIAIFRVGIQHTGELLDEILAHRNNSMPAPYVVADAGSCNSVTVCKVVMCGCNAHALRHFKELEERYPAEARYVLERYRAIYDHDDETAAAQMSPQARLDYHREHSRPLFKEMCKYGHKLLEDHAIEPNSDLGRAIDYLLNHQQALSAFYRYPGVPLDNNRAERELRLPVRLRDAAPFFNSKLGAAIAAQLWTLLVTTLFSNENLFDYLNAMQLHTDDVRKNPGLWLPWCYRERLLTLQQSAEQAVPTRAIPCPPARPDSTMFC